MNDSDYYDGLIFQGFVEGVPRAVLSGGYYGRLLRKFGRDLDAIGFAVYVNELDLLFRNQHSTDVDALILYEAGTDLNALAHAADGLRESGLKVRVERNVPENVRFGKIYHFTEDGLKEAGKEC